MRRRQFLGLVGGASISWPLTGHAQQTTLPVVGFLNSASADGYASMAAAFRQGLKETAYVEGNNHSSRMLRDPMKVLGSQRSVAPRGGGYLQVNVYAGRESNLDLESFDSDPIVVAKFEHD
jgi:hypothetical protein